MFFTIVFYALLAPSPFASTSPPQRLRTTATRLSALAFPYGRLAVVFRGDFRLRKRSSWAWRRRVVRLWRSWAVQVCGWCGRVHVAVGLALIGVLDLGGAGHMI